MIIPSNVTKADTLETYIVNDDNNEVIGFIYVRINDDGTFISADYISINSRNEKVFTPTYNHFSDIEEAVITVMCKHEDDFTNHDWSKYHG